MNTAPDNAHRFRAGTAAPLLAALGVSLFLGSHGAMAQDSVVGSPHDLSASGRGKIHALDEEQVCIFCHAPHNSTGQWPLWNREERRIHYRIYESSTTDARIDQPSGPSKMCLSCHDGAMALGLLASRPSTDPIEMNARTIPPGPSDLTDDLSDDHPIGFRYDRALSRRDPQLKNPEVISRDLPLGRHGEVHCTTCHDPHNNRLGDFLRLPQVRSTICLSCHEMFGWHGSSHALSGEPVFGRLVDERERLAFGTVAENACTDCHKIHGAGKSERLLRFAREEDNCLNCHSGSVARKNVETEFRKRSAHPITLSRTIHDTAENPLAMRRHVECEDCHNPHAVAPSPRSEALDATGGLVGPTTQFVRGVGRTGQVVEISRFEYEICFKCHADGATGPRRNRIARQIEQTNTRIEFQTGNPSFHPVLGPRRNLDVVSLIPPLRGGSVIRCTDCHNSDSAAVDGFNGASGPHGSIYEPILAANYDVRDLTMESPQAYALCYQCHDRQSILADESFPLHSQHVVRGRTPCSVCHDAHGVSRTQGNASSNSNLINFDRSIVQPASAGLGARVQFVDLGTRRGSCTLTCHGVTHVSFEYGR